MANHRYGKQARGPGDRVVAEMTEGLRSALEHVISEEGREASTLSSPEPSRHTPNRIAGPEPLPPEKVRREH